MPELPEVETTVRGLQPALEGRVLQRVETRRANLRRPFPLDLRQRLTGARVIGLGRRAKYGLIHTDRDDTLIFHLGMSGRWRIAPDSLEPHDHMLLETDEPLLLALYDPRRFGSVDLVDTPMLDQFGPFQTLGPEPLGPDLTAGHLAQAFAGRKSTVKALLLDQKNVAGLGNIYVCEALHMAGIRPDTPGARISRPRLVRLVDAIRVILEAAIRAGGSTLKDYAQPDGDLGYFANEWRVYGREGENCHCGAPVKRYTDGGRSTFWCARCQR